jgi:hypothetical protein
VEIDLLADLRSSINVILPNGNPLIQRVIYETLPKFCKHCKVLGHSIRACSKGKEEARTVGKVGSASVVVATKKSVKGGVFTLLSPSVDDFLVDAPPAIAPPVEVSHVDTPPTDAPKLDALIVPIETCVAQDEQHCSQATTAGLEEWQTVRKRRNNNGNKQHSSKSLPAESNQPPQQYVSA